MALNTTMSPSERDELVMPETPMTVTPKKKKEGFFRGLEELAVSGPNPRTPDAPKKHNIRSPTESKLHKAVEKAHDRLSENESHVKEAHKNLNILTRHVQNAHNKIEKNADSIEEAHDRLDLVNSDVTSAHERIDRQDGHAEQDKRRFDQLQKEIDRLKHDFYQVAGMVKRDGEATSKAIGVMMKADKAMLGLSRAMQELSMRVSALEETR